MIAGRRRIAGEEIAMSVWLVRAGRHGEAEAYNIEHGVAVIGFTEIPDLTNAKTSEAVSGRVRAALGVDATTRRVSNLAAQLHAFANRMESGDLIVMPLKSRPQVAIGHVSGNYDFRQAMGAPHHVRLVRWLRTDIPRTAFGQDLLASFGAYMTVCQIRRNGAEERIRAVVAGKPDPGMPVGDSAPASEGADSVADDEIAVEADVARLARDQIQAHVGMHFTGHRLADLVDAVLHAEGYATEKSDPGPDGGVDILAAKGSLGFDAPRLCVQVKSSSTPADVRVLRELVGTMTNFKAEQGLFVSWSGFNGPAMKEARQSFFTLRLWDADDLIEAVFRNYERLSGDLRQELPLKQEWTLVLEE